MGSNKRGNKHLYNSKFYRELEQTRDSAREILPIVIDLIKPASVVDVGCGAGYWLEAALQLGVNDVLGLEGEWIQNTRLAIPREKIEIRNLAESFTLPRRFDLAISLEVAEHLSPDRAREFVHELCQLSDKIFFSAAIPGQGGRNHLNEQWPAYWADLFAGFGYECHDLVRPTIWNNPRVLWYYAQNCLLFTRAGLYPQFGPPNSPLPLVHPTLWLTQLKRWNSPGKLAERLPKALLSRVRRPRKG